MAMMISWVMPVNPSHPYLENDPAPSFAPTICAFHLGFSLVDEVGLGKCMPPDLKPTLSALFAYRNKMFHQGFEWPRKELDKFDKMLKASNWPENWFTKAESDKQPWMFYMSPEFIDHCLGVIERIIKGIEKFDMKRIELSERKGDSTKFQSQATTGDNDEP